MRARTGVTPRLPIIAALVMSAPTQCETSMTSWPETPGKKYLLPPENPTTSCGNTGPTTRARSASATSRLMRTSTSGPGSSPPVSSASRAAGIVPRDVNVAGSQDAWLCTDQPGYVASSAPGS